MHPDDWYHLDPRLFGPPGPGRDQALAQLWAEEAVRTWRVGLCPAPPLVLGMTPDGDRPR